MVVCIIWRRHWSIWRGSRRDDGDRSAVSVHFHSNSEGAKSVEEEVRPVPEQEVPDVSHAAELVDPEVLAHQDEEWLSSDLGRGWIPPQPVASHHKQRWQQKRRHAS